MKMDPINKLQKIIDEFRFVVHSKVNREPDRRFVNLSIRRSTGNFAPNVVVAVVFCFCFCFCF